MEEELPTVRFYDRDGNEHREVLRTDTGRIITEADIEDWVAEAIEGYETHEFVLFMGSQTYKPSEGPKCQECGRPKSKHIVPNRTEPKGPMK